MVILAKQPPLKSASVVPVANSGLLSRPRTGAREELENQLSAVSYQPSAKNQTTKPCQSEPAEARDEPDCSPLAALEALSGSRLALLLPLFGAAAAPAQSLQPRCL